MKGYLYDNNGYFYGEVELQPSPLEPGVYFDQSSCTRTAPPKTKENQIACWNNESWEIRPDYSNKIYYSIMDMSEKRFEKGEGFEDNYTDAKPLENEKFQMFDDVWIVDEKAKFHNEKQILINQAKTLLRESDWTQTIDNLRIRGRAWGDSWAYYRSELRRVVNEEIDVLPEWSDHIPPEWSDHNISEDFVSSNLS